MEQGLDKNTKHDQKLTSELLNDPKEISEHLMLLDLRENFQNFKNKQWKVTESFKVENIHM